MKTKGSVLPLILISSVLIIILIGCNAGSSNRTYDFTEITRGSLEKTVSSSGSLTPVSMVNVLAQMSGKVERIHVDFNDQIRRGQILAELNTDMLKLRREQQRASVVKARANYELQYINHQNQIRLAERNLISDFELRTGRTTLDIHAAELAAAEASFNVIETEINQYAFITSPINGIVLARNINVGQNVVEGSSMNSASLFTLAEDLRKMKIEANVDELDIASIRIGQNVRFTLEAIRGQVFSGVVKKIHLMPTTIDNVVTYKVIINVDNECGTLLPGMTCEVEFIKEYRENILIVPNAAFRFQPSALSQEEIAERVFFARLNIMPENERNAALEARRAQSSAQAANSNSRQGGLSSLIMPQIPGRRAPVVQQSQQRGSRVAAAAGETIRTLWYVNNEGNLEAIAVRAGINNGSYTEIITDLDIEGKRIILRERF
ncbi:MAG: efflux RND transporter periplasmic adaptor subunit [Spirochaetes bacterium]|nr:efflux RND transporter periplasmic adaptor subunit [Spirochaetota bacterium]